MGQVNINSVEVKKSFLETILRSKIFWIFLIITVWFCAAFFIDLLAFYFFCLAMVHWRVQLVQDK